MTSADLPSPDPDAVAAALDVAQAVIDGGIARLVAGGIDQNQVWPTTSPMPPPASERRGASWPTEPRRRQARIACVFAAEALADLAGKVFGREADWGAARSAGRRPPGHRRVPVPAFQASLAGTDGPRGLADDFEMVQDTFRRFARTRSP